MRLVTYSFRGFHRLGVVREGIVIDLTRALERWYAWRGEAKAEARAHWVAPPGDMMGFLANGPTALEEAREAVEEVQRQLSNEALRAQGIVLELSEVKLEAPVRRPGKIACLWVNYVEHGNEAAIVPPTKEPVFFAKFSDVVIGPGDPIQLPRVSRAVDYEAELAVVIGREGKHIPEESALEYVAGYTILNDVSARDFNLKTLLGVVGPYIIQKTFDTFAPMGPYLVTRDEVPDPHALPIRLWINGELMQDGNSGEMIFKIPQIISYLSRVVTLRPGDVISTGTPPGVGHWRTPPRYLQPGETVRIEIGNLGVLENPVIREGEG